jgi:hypothetical protein
LAVKKKKKKEEEKTMYLNALNELPELRAEMRVVLIVNPSFRPPWRLTVEVTGDDFKISMCCWVARTRAEFGGTEFGMLSAVDKIPPVTEDGTGNLAIASREVLQAAGALRDLVDDGLFDSWTANVIYEDGRHSNRFAVRHQLTTAAAARHVMFLQAILRTARSVLKTPPSLWALGSLDL